MKKIIIINFLIIIFLIISLELIVKYYKLSDLMGMESEKLISRDQNKLKFKPNTSGLVFNKIVYTDKNGFRVPNKNYAYKGTNDSIIFFGDSVTFGNGIEETKTFVGLARKYFINYNFHNISLPGYQIKDHKDNLEMIKKIKKINHIIYVFTLNDIDFNNNVVNIADKKVNKDKLVEKLKTINLINYFNFWLRNKSYLYMYIKGISSDPSKRWFEYDYNLYNNDLLLNNFESFIDNLSEETNAQKIKLSILILPYEYQTRKNKCKYENLMPQTKIKKILLDKKINYYDLTDLFCSQKITKKLFYKFDPMHLSERGHNLVFNFIKNEIFN